MGHWPRTHGWLCCASIGRNSHIHRSHSLSLNAVICEFPLQTQQGQCRLPCHWPSLTEVKNHPSPHLHSPLHREELIGGPKRRLALFLLWPAVQSQKRCRGSRQCQEDAGHWSNEHLAPGSAHFYCKALLSSRQKLQFPICLPGHVSLSSVSQRCAEARIVDPAKPCPWQRCQKRALEERKSSR